jgi:hypothetical protein
MSEDHADAELIRLTARAKGIDEELASIQRDANASLIGSRERQQYSALRDQSEAAWQQVLDRVMTLKGLTDDLRELLPEEEA